MAKISFNAQALGIARYNQGTNVCHAVTRSTFKPVMVSRPGIEAIFEGLRLSNIEGFIDLGRNEPASDIDT